MLKHMQILIKTIQKSTFLLNLHVLKYPDRYIRQHTDKFTTRIYAYVFATDYDARVWAASLSICKCKYLHFRAFLHAF